MTTEEKKCVNCGATWGQIFNNPHECSGGELPRKRHVFPDLTAAPTRTGDWEKEFDKKFEGGWLTEKSPEIIKDFIRSKITKAIEAERERIRKLVTHELSLYDDGPNKGMWYGKRVLECIVKDINALTTLTKEENV